ncbi:hypothetical protein KC19_VG254500 [Ceratodon purpureus]|uniref:Secreted protein n=1 Tax=Ceratodon purpureus TaxID=3225 RepID=A0A8T0HTN3_CERPU|nr:hypothetical protein KC19_VG254500 [Ceratodon purpureus]
MPTRTQVLLITHPLSAVILMMLQYSQNMEQVRTRPTCPVGCRPLPGDYHTESDPEVGFQRRLERNLSRWWSGSEDPQRRIRNFEKIPVFWDE